MKSLSEHINEAFEENVNEAFSLKTIEQALSQFEENFINNIKSSEKDLQKIVEKTAKNYFSDDDYELTFKEIAEIAVDMYEAGKAKGMKTYIEDVKKRYNV